MRRSGILLHISSLPDKYGIGTLGDCAYRFVDFLKAAGQSLWQVLPLGPTGYGDSPYQCYSAFAGNPNFIDFTKLIEAGFLSENDPELCRVSDKSAWSDYSGYFKLKNAVLSRVYSVFEKKASEQDNKDFADFCADNAVWLDDYALYMTLKYKFDMKMWTMWEDAYRLRDSETLENFRRENAGEINYWKFLQFLFYKQYGELKAYAALRGIKIIGDIPIYVSLDSSDIWANPKLFALDGDYRPIEVAGCPPDVFSADGQLWGNPLYDWEAMESDGYAWWIRRIEAAGKLFDILRIDHFRGFESYYAIPASEKTARNGVWRKGPGANLFKVINQKGSNIPDFIAEDLGFLTDEVREMLRECGYPGMNILQFGFDGGDSSYMPHNFLKNSVSYIGTHDNDTALGWFKSASPEVRRRAKKYMVLSKKEGFVYGMIRTLMSSVSDTVVVQLQDWLVLGSSARFNTPSTIGGGNWLWQAKESDFSEKLAKQIKKLTERYMRLPPVKKVIVKLRNSNSD
jgi:4-alpha-glucanotransferase